MSITLRPYQNESIESIISELKHGVNRQLVVLPTGTGKTVIFSNLISQMKANKHVLILAHREELLHQALHKIRMVGDTRSVGFVKAEYDEHDKEIVLASVQTLSRESRLNEIDRDYFDVCIIDEAHHAVADSYLRILEYFKFAKVVNKGPLITVNSKKLLVGFTATPERADGELLGRVFEKVVYEKSLKQMIAEGYLTDLRGRRVLTNTDLSKVGLTAKGDFRIDELTSVINTYERNKIIVDSYLEYGEDRQGIAFTADVDHAEDLAEEFRDRGIPCQAVTGDTCYEDRERYLKEFSEGKLKVLTNCMVLTEGYDEPSVSVIMMARPTHSKSLYMQCIGRGTRLYPGKKDCLVIDYTHNNVDLCNLADIAECEMNDDETLTEALRRGTGGGGGGRSCPMTSAGQIIVTEMEMFSRNQFEWKSLGDGNYKIKATTEIEIYLKKNPDGTYTSALVEDNEVTDYLNKGVDIEYAMGQAEDFIRNKDYSEQLLSKSGAAWKQDLASYSQKKLMRSLKISYDEKTTKGEAQKLIQDFFDRRNAFDILNTME